MNYITNYTYKELEEVLISEGEKKFSARQIFDWVYRKSETSFDNMTNLSKSLREKLKSSYSVLPFTEIVVKESSDGTKKYLMTLQDGNKIEAVSIPEKDRLTVCISSQVGCKFGCSFCATGKMGYIRNLEVYEIVSEILLIQQSTGQRVTNVVYMGMGEPFDNYDNVIKSADILSDDRGLAIGTRKITISTSGHCEGIERYTKEDVRYKLAVSLHSPFDDVRVKMMPINNRYNIKTLFETLKKYTEKSKRKVVFEYILLRGVNDRDKDVTELKKLLSSLPSKLNLIRFHPHDKAIFEKTDRLRENQFYNKLRTPQFPVVFRQSRGEDIDAACGQLYYSEKNNS